MTPELRWLSDPTVFAVNRLDAHSDHLCCRTLDEAESGLTSLRQSLDGAWRFAWSANPAARPADFWQPDADLSGFGTIRVPGTSSCRATVSCSTPTPSTRGMAAASCARRRSIGTMTRGQLCQRV